MVVFDNEEIVEQFITTQKDLEKDILKISSDMEKDIIKTSSGMLKDNVKKEDMVLVGELNSDNLKKLFENEICVLHVKNYTSKDVSMKLHNFFMSSEKREKYTHEQKDEKSDEFLMNYFGVDRIGTPLNTVYLDETGKRLKKYFLDANKTLKQIRKAVDPYLSPIDKLRVELDEEWVHGSNLAVFKGIQGKSIEKARKMFAGIGRIMPKELSHLSEEQPHYDMVPKEYFEGIEQQFAANIYLNVPKKGGRLEIWNAVPLSLDQRDFEESDWRGKLKKDGIISTTVKPECGDLLLFNTRRPHAITSFKDINFRTSIQSFIGVKKTKEIFLWD